MNIPADLSRHIPLWGVFILTFFLLWAAFECGLFLGRRRRAIAEEEDRSPVGSIVAAALGLLAFLLAFTFGIAVSKFDARSALVVDESNAIGTTFLRAEYLPVSHRSKVKKLLQQYISTRLEALERGNLAKGIEKSEDLQNQLWLQAVAIAEDHPHSVIVGLFIQSLNEMIDVHAKRVHVGVRIRIPMVIWYALYFVTLLAIGSVGYQIGLIHTRYLGITLLLILTFSAVIVLIVDLDTPQEGFIRVSQEPLIDLHNKLVS